MQNFSNYIVGLFALLFATPLALANGMGSSTSDECGWGTMGHWGMDSAGQFSTGMFGLGIVFHALIWLSFIALTVYIARKVWDAAAPKKTKK